ncbi:MAG: hypothetical protein ABR517_01245 [Thermoanaerobaculia bacterium]
MKRINAFTIVILMTAAAMTAATLQKELPASAGETLSVELRGGSIEVVGSSRNTVRVDATISGKEVGDADLEVRRTRGGVEVSDRGTRHRGNSRIHVRIEVPRSFDLDLETMGGTISVENVHGSITGKTLGGELRLARLDGELSMVTHGGNITLRDSNVDGSVRTMGGQVLLDNVSGDVKGTSMGGNVVYRNVSRPDGTSTGKSVQISTMGGHINVAEAPDGAELSTMGGNVRVRNARGFVKAKTMGGTITLDAVDGWVEATTMGGNVGVKMVGNPEQGDRHVRIDSKGGDIELSVPAGLDMDIDIQIAFTRNSSRKYEIRSDFPLQVTTSPEWDSSHGTPRRIIQGRGKSGSGKHKIVIRTINGDVKLTRGGK